MPNETYAYDDNGRRLKKTVGGSSTHYAYDGPDLIAEYSDPASNPSAVYAHSAGIDEPLVRLTGASNSPSASATYYAQDGLGSVIAAFGGISDGGSVAASSVTATNSYSEASYPSAKLIDGDTTGSGGFWAGSSANLATTPATATLELGGTKTVSRITLNRVMSYNANYIVKDAEVQIRNPDNSWTTVGTLTGNSTQDSPEIALTNATGSALKVLIKGVRSGNLVLLAEVAMQFDGSAQSIATQRFDAWGNLAQASGTIPQFGYTGREPDQTGLVYYRARYYQPGVGRFASRDPLGFAAGINPYAYADGNPIRYNDPEGLFAVNAWNTGATYFRNPLVQETMATIGNGASLLGNVGHNAVNGGAGWLERFLHLDSGSLGRVTPPIAARNEVAQQVANDMFGVISTGLMMTPLRGGAVSETVVMQGLVDSANARFAANPAAAAAQLKAGELRAVQSNPGLTSMFYGTALERSVAETVRNTPSLANTFAHLSKPGASVPDFRSAVTGATFDITTNTPRSFADHLARPYGQGLNLLPYNRPQGFSFP